MQPVIGECFKLDTLININKKMPIARHVHELKVEARPISTLLPGGGIFGMESVNIVWTLLETWSGNCLIKKYPTSHLFANLNIISS